MSVTSSVLATPLVFSKASGTTVRLQGEKYHCKYKIMRYVQLQYALLKTNNIHKSDLIALKMYYEV